LDVDISTIILAVAVLTITAALLLIA